MRFSVIIPVYNVEPWLRECLDSVLRQTCGDWEAVCVDDGSTDRSGEILEQYAQRDNRIKAIHQPNGGLSAARNTGLDNAHGDYVLFLDSDDWLEPNTLERINNKLPTTHYLLPTTDLLCFGGWRGHEEERPAPATYTTGWDYYNHCALAQHTFPFVCVVLRCYRRQFLEDNGLRFREGILHEDNHFTPRACLAAGAVRVIQASLYHYRLREGSIMTTRTLRSRQDMLRIANDLAALFTKRTDLDRRTIYRALTHHYQAAFAGATRRDRDALLPLVDWHLYRTVSRTRPRHRLNYSLIFLHLSVSLFFK
ncbi:MAG: glycosyltransferase [Bacteroidales bacterium]|nr:glycosyltransferase [Bacteroidales bacterium]